MPSGKVPHEVQAKQIGFSHDGGRRNLRIGKSEIAMVENRNPGPAGFGAARQDGTPHTAPTREALIKPEKCCVYNQTRERFVATDVKVADALPGGAEAHLRALGEGAGTGLWIVPYRQISPTSIRFPVDLAFLDNDCVVLATVESFPLASLPDSSADVSSLLALPAETVAKGELLLGDRLIIAESEEMKRHLQRMKTANAEAPIEAAPGKAEIPSGEEGLAEKLAAPPPIDPDVWKKRLGTRSWFTTLLRGDPADPRKGLREDLPGLIAYFFTGGSPVAQRVRDISMAGMYIITNESWYLGTVVRVTLTDRDHPTAERTLTVNAQAVRQGTDGVGLEFILEKQDEHGTVLSQTMERTLGVNQARVESFLEELKKPPSRE